MPCTSVSTAYLRIELKRHNRDAALYRARNFRLRGLTDSKPFGCEVISSTLTDLAQHVDCFVRVIARNLQLR